MEGNQDQYIIQLFTYGILLVVLIAVFIFLQIKRRKAKQSFSESVYQLDMSPPEHYRKIYRFLSSFKPTRSYTARVRIRYEMLEPGNVERIERDTVRSMTVLFALVAAAVGIVLIMHVSLYSVLLVVLTIYCGYSEYLAHTTQQMKQRLLSQLRTEIEQIQNNYNRSEDVCDAIYEAALNAPFPVKNHLLNIWEVLQTDDIHINTEVERFNIRAPLPYLKDLLSCAKETSKYGDNNVHGISNFILKLTGIMNAVSAAERIEEERQSAFAGQAVVSFIPFYIIPATHWFVRQMFDVDTYLNGVYGIVSIIGLFLLMLFIYSEVVRRRELDYVCARSHPALQRICDIPWINSIVSYMTDRNVSKKNAIQGKIHKIGESLTVEQFMLQRLICGMVGLFATIILCLSVQVSVRGSVLTSESGISAKIAEGTTEEEEQEIIQFVITTAYDLKDAEISEDVIRRRVENVGTLFMTETSKDMVVQEITDRIHSYQNMYFKWWYLILAAGAMVGSSYLPYLFLRRDPAIVAIRSNDEIMRFQTIISCMKDIKRGSVKEVLEEMELSSDIFRNTLTDCVDEYSADPYRALEKFQARERDHPLLQQLCMKFMRADRVGLQKAFANLEAEMVECQKSREQKCHLYIRRASNLMNMIIFIPVILTVVMEALVPMGLALIQQMGILFRTMGQ